MFLFVDKERMNYLAIHTIIALANDMRDCADRVVINKVGATPSGGQLADDGFDSKKLTQISPRSTV